MWGGGGGGGVSRFEVVIICNSLAYLTIYCTIFWAEVGRRLLQKSYILLLNIHVHIIS